MKLNKILLATGLGLAMSVGTANAADAGHGKITFTGSVIEAPCSINPDSLDQTKPLGAISRSWLEKGNTL